MHLRAEARSSLPSQGGHRRPNSLSASRYPRFTVIHGDGLFHGPAHRERFTPHCDINSPLLRVREFAAISISISKYGKLILQLHVIVATALSPLFVELQMSL